MKNSVRTTLTLLAALLRAPTLHAQAYDISWHKVAGGGSTSTGGGYSISGTIGQPDAGQMTGGSYILTGGFWAVITAGQSSNAPVLRIVFTGTNTVVVAWPAPSTGFSLQQNAVLGSANWVSVPNPVNVVGFENQVIVSPPTGNGFYRLKK